MLGINLELTPLQWIFEALSLFKGKDETTFRRKTDHKTTDKCVQPLS